MKKLVLVASLLILSSCKVTNQLEDTMSLAKGFYVCKAKTDSDLVKLFQTTESDLPTIYTIYCTSGTVITLQDDEWKNINDPMVKDFFDRMKYRECIRNTSISNSSACDRYLM